MEELSPLKQRIKDFEFDCSVREYNRNKGFLSIEQFKEEVNKLRLEYQEDIKRILDIKG